MNKTILSLIISSLISLFGFGNISTSSFTTKYFYNPNDSVRIAIPNIFTPNSDEKNDTWSMIIDNGLEIFDMETIIYNRFGKQVFESTNIRQNWNGNNLYEGNPCAAGTYFYIISYTDGNSNETKTLKGFLELIK